MNPYLNELLSSLRKSKIPYCINMAQASGHTIGSIQIPYGGIQELIDKQSAIALIAFQEYFICVGEFDPEDPTEPKIDFKPCDRELMYNMVQEFCRRYDRVTGILQGTR